MATLGITGGIASGKSTIRRLLLDRIDADFFDSDACARQLLEENPTVRDEVIRNVSADAYSPNGEPDRAHLREVIFTDPTKRATLESILHPIIRERWTSEASRRQERLLVVEIPLLFETGAEALFDHIIVVACSEATQIRRLTDDRHLPGNLARNMLAAQWSLDLKLSAANHVIWNDSSLVLAVAQTDLLAALLNTEYA